VYGNTLYTPYTPHASATYVSIFREMHYKVQIHGNITEVLVKCTEVKYYMRDFKYILKTKIQYASGKNVSRDGEDSATKALGL
jgi:hypothetical protein